MFPNVPEEAFSHTYRNIDLLIGLDHHRLHPKGGKDIGNFELVEYIFGCGTILTGSTNGTDARECTSDIAFHMTNDPQKSPLLFEGQSNVPYYGAVDFGITPPKPCNDCHMCLHVNCGKADSTIKKLRL